jgi:hypothetical protein
MEFLIDSSPWVDSTFNRKGYQGYFLEGKGGRCVRLTNLPTSCLEIREPQTPENIRACSSFYRDCLVLKMDLSKVSYV